MMSRTGPPCDRYFGPFGSWHRLAILESRLAVDAGPLRLGGEVGAHHLRALDVALSADLRQRPGLPYGLSP